MPFGGKKHDDRAAEMRRRYSKGRATVERQQHAALHPHRAEPVDPWAQEEAMTKLHNGMCAQCHRFACTCPPPAVEPIGPYHEAAANYRYYQKAVDGLKARIAELEAELERTHDYVEAQFDALTADQIAEVARAKGEDVEAKAARVREIFQAAYRRVTGKE
jgi:hypothetical protein